MKKLFGTKGQGAMEYLMTYGWAILVVMVVGIAMWQLGIFNMGGTTVTSTGFAKIKPQLAGTGLSSSGTFTGVFTNGVGTRILIEWVHITDNADNDADVCSITSPLTTNVQIGGALAGSFTGAGSGDGVTVSAGRNFEVILGPACTLSGSTEVTDVYDIKTIIDYVVDIGGVSSNHRETGNFRGPLE